MRIVDFIRFSNGIVVLWKIVLVFVEVHTEIFRCAVLFVIYYILQYKNVKQIWLITKSDVYVAFVTPFFPLCLKNFHLCQKRRKAKSPVADPPKLKICLPLLSLGQYSLISNSPSEFLL